MAYRYVDLKKDTACPYCGTLVPAGSCLCGSCGAAYMSIYRSVLTPLVFFVVGLFLGNSLFEANMILIALILTCVGSVATKRWADTHPQWHKGTW